MVKTVGLIAAKKLCNKALKLRKEHVGTLLKTTRAVQKLTMKGRDDFGEGCHTTGSAPNKTKQNQQKTKQTSHKKVFSMKTNTCRDGTLKNQPNKIGTTPQYFYTIPTSCAILPTMHCVCYLCAQKVVLGMEGCGMSSTGCVVHVVVYGEWVVCWWL